MLITVLAVDHVKHSELGTNMSQHAARGFDVGRSQEESSLAEVRYTSPSRGT
jgi:hypothetical protein